MDYSVFREREEDSSFLWDRLFCDGFIVLYGPVGVGKTNLLLFLASKISLKEKLFLLHENSNLSRLKDFNAEMKNVLIGNLSVNEYNKLMDSKGLTKIDNVFIDDLGRYYRRIMDSSRKKANDFLLDIVGSLKFRKRAVITTHMYKDLATGHYRMAGGDFLLGADIILELAKVNNRRYIIIRKHPYLLEGSKYSFEILEKEIVFYPTHS